MIYGFVRMPMPPVPNPPRQGPKQAGPMPPVKFSVWDALAVSTIVMSIMIGLGILFSSAAAEAHPGDAAAKSSPGVLAAFIIVGLLMTIGLFAKSGKGHQGRRDARMLKNPPMPLTSKVHPNPRNWTPPE